MTSEEAYWAGLGPEDFIDEEPMKTTLTKEQRAEMRRFADRLEPCPSWVYTLLDSHALADEALNLATAKLATATVCERCFDEKNSTYEGIPRFFKNCPNCTNGVVISDQRARELLEELDRLRHVEQLYAASESLRKQLNDAAVKDATKFNELLERLKRAEADALRYKETAENYAGAIEKLDADLKQAEEARAKEGAAE